MTFEFEERFCSHKVLALCEYIPTFESGVAAALCHRTPKPGKGSKAPLGGSAGFQTCCIADFQIGSMWWFQDAGRSVWRAGLETRDIAPTRRRALRKRAGSR